MTIESIIKESWILLDLVISVILGFLIGLERKIRFKEAGIRTHTIVCLGSALMMAISMNAFGTQSDAGRVAAQIVSGIGFLGAGMIIYKRNAVKGLTTAAGVWATAGVGMACGARLYLLATGATAIMIAVQCILHIKCRLFRMKKYYTLRVEFVCNNQEDKIVKDIFGIEHFIHISAIKEGEDIVYKATLSAAVEPRSVAINQIFKLYPFIKKIERGESD